jgi:hypothetical protein
MSIVKRTRTLEARLYERYPERLRQPLAFNAEGQDLRADGPAFAGVSFLIFPFFFKLMRN